MNLETQIQEPTELKTVEGPYLRVEIAGMKHLSEAQTTWILERLRTWMPDAVKILADDEVQVITCEIREEGT